MARVVLPGGSGYLGGHLAGRLRDRGDEVVVLTRGVDRTADGVRYVHWDGATLGDWATELEGADVVVHLAGKRVDVRPTRRNIDALIRSRVESVHVVGEALRRVKDPPQTWVQIGTMAIFGDGGDTPLDESVTPPTAGPRQMVTVATEWERAYEQAAVVCDRRVLLRCGVAIGPGDPALEQLTRLARLGLGGRIASGRQWVTWIALDDLLAVIERAIDEQEMDGCYHVCSPEPVRNRELMAEVRSAVGRSFGLPSPAPLTWLGAWMLGSDPALALTGRRGAPDRLQQEGVDFARPRLAEAIRAARTMEGP